MNDDEDEREPCQCEHGMAFVSGLIVGALVAGVLATLIASDVTKVACEHDAVANGHATYVPNPGRRPRFEWLRTGK